MAYLGYGAMFSWTIRPRHPAQTSESESSGASHQLAVSAHMEQGADSYRCYRRASSCLYVAVGPRSRTTAALLCGAIICRPGEKIYRMGSPRWDLWCWDLFSNLCRSYTLIFWSRPHIHKERLMCSLGPRTCPLFQVKCARISTRERSLSVPLVVDPPCLFAQRVLSQPSCGEVGEFGEPPWAFFFQSEVP